MKKEKMKFGLHTGRADCCKTDSCDPKIETEEKPKENISSKMFIFCSFGSINFN